MELKYDSIDDFKIDIDENISDSRINKSLFKLYENDRCIDPDLGYEPEIWECKWFNDDSIEGYPRGYAVWLNTENKRQFINNKSDNIYQYAKNNNILTRVIQEYKSNDRDIYNLYAKIMDGYVDSTKKQLSAIYYIGDNTKEVQIRISKIDNNKYKPDNDDYWYDFFVRSGTRIDQYLKQYGQYLLEQHLKDYHINCDTSYSVDDYANVSLNNITDTQRFIDKYQDNDIRGFDYFRKFKFIADSSHTISINQLSIDTLVETKTLYTLTNKNLYGHYELEGAVSKKSDIEEKFSTVGNYSSGRISQIADVTLETDENQAFCDIQFRLSGTSSDDFPNLVSYTDSRFSSIETILPYYEMSYKIKPLSIDYSEDLDSSDTENYVFVQHHILSTYNVDDIEDADLPMYTVTETTITTNYDTNETRTCSTVDNWVKVWNSGYIEQGGTIILDNILSVQNIFVPFQESYDYAKNSNSFYSTYSSFDNGITYNKTNNIDEEDRYVVTLTPVSDSYQTDTNVEINTIRNDGFYMIVDQNSPKQYFYSVCGFKRM